MAFKEYSNFLEKNKVLENTASSKQIKEIGLRIKAAAEAYFAHNNNSAYLSDYAWEFNLVDNPQKNAWCMPGGKIVFYTGILQSKKNKSKLWSNPIKPTKKNCKDRKTYY